MMNTCRIKASRRRISATFIKSGPFSIPLVAAFRAAAKLGKFRKSNAGLFCLKMPGRLFILSVL